MAGLGDMALCMESTPEYIKFAQIFFWKTHNINKKNICGRSFFEHTNSFLVKCGLAKLIGYFHQLRAVILRRIEVHTAVQFQILHSRSSIFVIGGYAVPGHVGDRDGSWMAWENYSAVADAVAHPPWTNVPLKK